MSACESGLAGAQDERSDGYRVPLVQRVAKQGVRLRRSGLRYDEVRRLEERRLDLVARDEVLDVDRLRRADVRLREILRLDDDVPVLLDLVPLDDVLPLDGLTGRGVHPLVADRGEIAAVEQAEVELVRAALGRDEADGDLEQAEADRAAPGATRGAT